jgi:hypothetical protein
MPNDWAQYFPQYAVSEWIGHDITVSATHCLAVPEQIYQKLSGLFAGGIGEPNGVRFAPKSAPKSESTA